MDDREFTRGARIKKAREAAWLTQEQMSTTFGIPKRTLEDWERGVRNPPEWVVGILVKVLTNKQIFAYFVTRK